MYPNIEKTERAREKEKEIIKEIIHKYFPEPKKIMNP